MNFKFIFSSPIFYVLLGYLAAWLCLGVQDAVVAEFIVAGGFISNTLTFTLIPVTLLSPLLAAALALRHVCLRVRLIESIAAFIVAIPMLLLWCAVISGSIVGLLNA